VPLAICLSAERSKASTVSFAFLRRRCWTWPRLSSGTVKIMVMGWICVTTASVRFPEGLHDVARIDEAQSDSAGDWRDDVAIVHLDLIEAYDAFIEFERALLLEDDLFLIIEGLFGNGLAIPGFVITQKIHL